MERGTRLASMASSNAPPRSYAYDARGNILSDGLRAYSWDDLDRMRSVTVAGVTTTYRYDARDRRVAESTASDTVRYVYDGLLPVMKLDGSGHVRQRYVYGAAMHEPVAYITYDLAGEATEYVLHRNALGDITAVTNGAGLMLERYEYTAYGERIVVEPASGLRLPGTGVGNPFGYRGFRLDERTGLYNLPYRDYDPTTGRFLSSDPARDGMNWYMYTSGDPIGAWDPMGLLASSSYISNWLNPLNLFSWGVQYVDDAVIDWATNNNHSNIAALATFHREMMGLAQFRSPFQIVGDIRDSIRSYEGAGLGTYDATVLSTIGQLPGLSALMNGYELYHGQSFQSSDFGQSLHGVEDYAPRVANVVATAASLAAVARAGYTGASVRQGQAIVSSEIEGAVESRGGVDLHLQYKEGWTPAQRAAADAKVIALSEANTVVVKSPVRSGTAQSRYRKAAGLDATQDADHLIDLQLGGVDDFSNLWGLDNSVNRSLGSQIQKKIRPLPDKTVVNRVTIGE